MVTEVAVHAPSRLRGMTSTREMTERIQTPHYTSGVHVRVNADLTRSLVVSDSAGGVHVYEEDTP